MISVSSRKSPPERDRWRRSRGTALVTGALAVAVAWWSVTGGLFSWLDLLGRVVAKPTGPLVFGLAGLAGGADEDVDRLIEKIARFQAGEDDVEFSTEREDQVGRLYDAVASLAESTVTRERELEESEAWYRAIAESARDAIVTIDGDSTIRFANPAVEEVFGYRPAELVGESLSALIPERLRERHHEAVAAFLETGERTIDWTDVEFPGRRKDGSEINLSISFAAFEAGDEQRFLGLMRDVTERRQHEQQLRERERRLEQYRKYTEEVLDAIDDVFYIVDDERTLQRWNESLNEVTGYTDEEVAAMDVRDFFDEEDAQRVTAALDDIEQRVGDPVEAAIVTQDGESIPFEFVAAPLEDPDGNRVIAGIGRDVTDRKRTERDLERTAGLLKRVQRMAKIGGWELDVTTDPPEQTWTEEMYRLHDLPPETVVDVDTIVDAYHPDDRDRVRETIETSLENEEGYDVEARIEDGQDGTRWVRAIGDAIHEDGELVKYQGTIQDVTDRKEREQELRAANERMQQFIETSPVGVVATDPEGTVTLWNDGMEQIFGWEASEVLGEEFPAEPDGQSDGRERIRQPVLRGESVSQVELERVTRDGELIDVTISAGPVRDESGAVTEIVAYVEDITERKARESELERTKDLLTQSETLADVGGWEIDLRSDANDLFMTDELCRLHGLSPGTEIAVEEGIEFVHPDDRPQVREAIDAAIERGESYDQVFRFQPADGPQLWVRAIGKAVEEDGEVVAVRGSLQDVTDRKEREMALRSLHEAARGLLGAETETAAAELVVETATAVLDVPHVGVYLLDEATNRLRPVAYTDGFERISGGAPPVGANEDAVVWNCFAAGNRTVVGSGDAGRSQIFGEDVEGGLLVPVGDHGVFALATDAGEVGDATRRLVETFVATAEAAFDRLANEAEIRERDDELAAQNQRLRRQIQITEIIRGIDQSLVGVSSREEVETGVCERLVEADDVAFAWIGTVEPGDDELVPRSWAGDGQTYLNDRSFLASDGAAEPAARTARTGEPTVVPNVTEQLRGESWRREALADGYHSVVSVPLTFEEYSYGVLTVYADEPDVFGDFERTVFAELGRNIADAISAVKTRTALHADSLVELTLRMEGEGDVLARVARGADCTVEFEGLTTRSTEETRLFVVTTGADADDVRAVLDDLVSVQARRLISEDENRCLFEVTVGASTLAAKLVRHGASPRSITASPSGTEFVVDVPTATDVREFLGMLREQYDSVELAARRDVDREVETRQQLVSSLFEDLTERQLEVLRTAYLSGYFEWPRGSTGEDIAEMLGVTQPTVNRHLRLGQQRLLARLFAEDAPALQTG